MTDFPERIGLALQRPVAAVRSAGGQHGYRHLIATLGDGRQAFVKAADAPGPDEPETFAAEANGLRWLAAADGGAPVPRVLGSTGELLAIEYRPPGTATPEAAADFGAALARTHAAGAEHFGSQHRGGPYWGAPWPGRIASLPLDNTLTATTTGWGEWWQARRAVPYIKRAADDHLLSAADLRLMETVAARAGDLGGPREPPSRIHGDLWSGNVLWSGGRGWLIDPAAHGGHRESDLAMLRLFGAPHLDRILEAYDAEFPLADGWRARIPLHQIHPLLVHVCLFGGAYAGRLRAAARAALAA